MRGSPLEYLLAVRPDENIAAILRKLEAVPAGRVIITSTDTVATFRNPVSIRLLARRAHDLALAVAIVTDDDFTRWLCEQVGLPAFATVKSVRHPRSALSITREGLARAHLRLGGWVSGVLGLAVLAAVALLLFFVLPAATVTVTPAPKALAVDVPVLATVTQDQLDAAAGRVPANVASTEVAGDAQVRATGTREAPDGTAGGLVTITNTTAGKVDVPAGTIFAGGAVDFVSGQDVVVPPSLKVGSVALPGTVALPVKAVNPGPSGNVKAHVITGLPPGLAGKLRVSNDFATSGGTRKKVNYLSGADQGRAKDALRTRLVNLGLQRIRGQISRNETFLPDPGAAGDGAIEQLTYDQSPVQVTGTTTLHMRV
ncbi:MAG: baseplate J/gp47 family protein, partial [Chloroflexota bacterium]